MENKLIIKKLLAKTKTQPSYDWPRTISPPLTGQDQTQIPNYWPGPTLNPPDTGKDQHSASHLVARTNTQPPSYCPGPTLSL